MCLDGEKNDRVAFQARADYQNHAIGWLHRGYSSLGGGKVVRIPRIWMVYGECRFKGRSDATQAGLALARARGRACRERSSRAVVRAGWWGRLGSGCLKGVQTPRRLASHWLGRAVALAVRLAHGQLGFLDVDRDLLRQCQGEAAAAFAAAADRIGVSGCRLRRYLREGPGVLESPIGQRDHHPGAAAGHVGEFTGAAGDRPYAAFGAGGLPGQPLYVDTRGTIRDAGNASVDRTKIFRRS